MNKKNIKRLGTVALVSMLCLGASAWLTNRETASGVTHIKTATLVDKVYFNNQGTKIELTDNEAIPMTKAYAAKNNEIYTFNIQNDAVFGVDYDIDIEDGSYKNDFKPGAAKLVLVEVDTNDDEATIRTKLAAAEATVQDVATGTKYLSVKNLASKANKKYALIVYLDSTVTNSAEEYIGKGLKITLRVNSSQTH